MSVLNILSIAFTSIWLILLILLHFLKSDFKPNSHTCSEYAIGKYGWLMQIAFFSMAFSYLLISINLHSVLFGIACLGWIGLGVWKADFTLQQIGEKATKQGRLHLLFGLIAMISIDILAFVIPISYLAWFILLSHIAFIVSMNIKKPIIFGIIQRIYILLITFWTIIIMMKW